MAFFQLSDRTMALLKNFSAIEQRMIFQPGFTIATRRPNNTLLAVATIAEEIPEAFAIYEMNKFLGIVSQMDEPTFSLELPNLLIKKGKRLARYTTAKIEHILTELKLDPYEKTNPKLPSVDAEFSIDKDEWRAFKRSIDVLKLPQIAVVGDGETLALQGVDVKKPSADVYSVEVGTTDMSFRAIVEREALVVLDQDYKVQVCKRGFMLLEGEDVKYFAPLNPQHSTFS